jgi:hypothetical protein
MRAGKTAPLRAGSFLPSSSRPFSLLSLSRGSRISSLRDRVAMGRNRPPPMARRFSIEQQARLRRHRENPMPATINLYQIGVWLRVGVFTGAGWAIAAVIVGRIFAHI